MPRCSLCAVGPGVLQAGHGLPLDSRTAKGSTAADGVRVTTPLEGPTAPAVCLSRLRCRASRRATGCVSRLRRRAPTAADGGLVMTLREGPTAADGVPATMLLEGRHASAGGPHGGHGVPVTSPREGPTPADGVLVTPPLEGPNAAFWMILGRSWGGPGVVFEASWRPSCLEKCTRIAECRRLPHLEQLVRRGAGPDPGDTPNAA